MFCLLENINNRQNLIVPIVFGSQHAATDFLNTNTGILHIEAAKERNGLFTIKDWCQIPGSQSSHIVTVLATTVVLVEMGFKP